MAINPVRLALAVAALMLNLSVIQQTKADSFLTNSPLATARAEHTATLLPNGKVLVAGGNNRSGDLSSAELYDPARRTWAATGAMTTTRNSHTATLLANGEVLVAGGYPLSLLSSTALTPHLSCRSRRSFRLPAIS